MYLIVFGSFKQKGNFRWLLVTFKIWFHTSSCSYLFRYTASFVLIYCERNWTLLYLACYYSQRFWFFKSLQLDSNPSGFESSCSHLNFRFRACFEQGVSWHSGNYRVWIHSERRTWHDKNVETMRIFLTSENYPKVSLNSSWNS